MFISECNAVLQLLKNADVQGILGPQTLTEETFTTELGRRAHVPVISFTARSQSRSHPQNPYSIRATPDNSNQAKALATICKGFEWHEVVILHEDSDYGSQFNTKLSEEFLNSGIRMAYIIALSTSSKDHYIKKELERLMNVQNRVFIVHMNAVLGVRLFLLAKQAGMMGEGYAWIITDSLGNFLNSMDSTTFDSMEGVLGIRPHVPKSEKLESFKARWKKNMLLTKPQSIKTELNVYGLWAYDTVWALAMAVERVGPVNFRLSRGNIGENECDIFNPRISKYGPELLTEVSQTTFQGLVGEFQLIDGQLKPSALEIFNVIGTGDRIIGYWTPDGGITRELAASSDMTYSTSTKELKRIVWPGDSVEKPLGWSIPTTGKLKVGVPRKIGFTEFVNIGTDESEPTGFSIDIFLCALKHLPFHIDYKFIPFINESGSPKGTYNDLLHNMSYLQAYDVIVGDATILADRAEYVDFTLPYSESGVVWVVKNKQNKDMWIFTQPFRWDLWATILVTCIFIGVVLRVLEHQENCDSNSVRLQRQQLRFLFWFPIAVLAFPERNMVANSWSRFVLVVWLFMCYILMQSYTANLSAMFTVDQLDFRFSGDYNIGYQEGSFVRDFLVTRLHISESKLKQYSTIQQYHDAMTKGSKNGGIDAIADEIPYMKLLLSRYGSKYKILGERYRTDGFGFAFPKDSPLVVHFSRAILAVKEGPNMTRIEEKNFGPGYSSENQLDSINEQNSLTAYNFGGLFIIIGSAMIFALFFSETSVGKKFIVMAIDVSHKCFSSLPFGSHDARTTTTVHANDSKDISSEFEVELTEQNNLSNLVRSGTNHQSGSGVRNSDVSAIVLEGNESDQSNDSGVSQQPSPGNVDITGR